MARGERRIAYLTDVEGQWKKLEDFCRDNPLVSLDEHDQLTVASGGVFVFGGDAIDRGPGSRRLVRALTRAKARSPDAVVLLAGNRDINKMRLPTELSGEPPPRALEALDAATLANRPALLAFIFSRTMGAGDAFEHRRRELEHEGQAHDDEAVAQSFLDDLEPDGDLSRYLASLALAHREGETLFVHGAVTRENLGAVPQVDSSVRTLSAGASLVDDWVAALNDFYRTSIDAFRQRRQRGTNPRLWDTLVAYQAPLRGTRLNQASIVYGRPTDDRANPLLPEPSVVSALEVCGVRRVVIGHTPSGDCPAILRDDGGFELVLADNSYGRVEYGPQVAIDGSELRVRGRTRLDSGEEGRVDYEGSRLDRSPLGRRDLATGELVKAMLDDGRYLLFKGLADYAVSQKASPEAEVARRDLGAPR